MFVVREDTSCLCTSQRYFCPSHPNLSGTQTTATTTTTQYINPNIRNAVKMEKKASGALTHHVEEEEEEAIVLLRGQQPQDCTPLPQPLPHNPYVNIAAGLDSTRKVPQIPHGHNPPYPIPQGFLSNPFQIRSQNIPIATYQPHPSIHLPPPSTTQPQPHHPLSPPQHYLKPHILPEHQPSLYPASAMGLLEHPTTDPFPHISFPPFAPASSHDDNSSYMRHHHHAQQQQHSPQHLQQQTVMSTSTTPSLYSTSVVSYPNPQSGPTTTTTTITTTTTLPPPTQNFPQVQKIPAMVTKKRKLSRSDSPVQQRQHGVTAEDNTDEEAEDDEEEEEEEGEEPEGEGEEGGGSGEKINRGPRQKKSKKGRNQPTKKRATTEQTAILEAAFQSGMIPDQSTRRRLAAQLGFPERRVQIWFQNRRAKLRRGDKNSQVFILNKGTESYQKKPRQD